MPEAKKGAAQVDDVVVKDTPEQALAAQQEGFAEAETSTAAPSKTVEKTAEQISQAADAAAKVAQETAAEEAKAAAEAANKPVLAGLTEAQLKDRLEKADKYDGLKASIDKVNGKFGSIEAKLKEMAEAKNAGVQMTTEDIADLEEEYGPELAAALLKTLNKFGAKIGKIGAAAPDDKAAAKPDEVQTKIDAATKAAKEEVKAEIEATKQSTELKFLSREHKDWRSLIQGEPILNPDGTPQVDANGHQLRHLKPEFLAWTKTLPQADQKSLLASWDAEFLSDKIGEYKQHIATEKAAAEAEAKKQTTTPKRITTAVTPKSVPGTAVGKTALDEQKEGYASA